MKLCLGVIDVPEPEGGTTYSVGKELEDHYGLFSMFYNTYKEPIGEYIAEDMADALTKMLNDETVHFDKAFAKTSEEITDKMHYFITSQEVERVAGRFGEQGIPTQAALDGKTLREKSKQKRGKKIRKASPNGEYFEMIGARRPSFMYSGILEHSLKGWVEK